MRNRKTREALCLWAITACLLAVSCVQLPEPVTPEDLSRIAAEKRFRQLEQRKLLRVAVSTTGGDFAYLTQDGIFEGQEVKAVLNAAHRNGWRVFFFASRPESLYSYVRRPCDRRPDPGSDPHRPSHTCYGIQSGKETPCVRLVERRRRTERTAGKRNNSDKIRLST